MIYSFGQCELDTERLELRRDGELQAVEPQVFSLLVLLIENRDHVVSKDDLIAAVWDGRIVSDASLSSRISAARTAVGDTGRSQAIIRTTPKRGFRFVADILQDEAARADPPSSAHDDYTTGKSASQTSAEVEERLAIAVLPFENLSADPEQEYFADGISEDIITSLSKLSQLLVIARNSSFTYKGRAVKAQEIARELGVRYVIEGSVRKSGNRVRITSKLIDCTTGGHLWAERFDRDLTDIFAVQDEVTRKIVAAMAVKLTVGDHKRLKTIGTDNLKAYDYFLRGRELFWRQSKEENSLAKAMFERARDLDPMFAPAYAFLSFTHVMDYINEWIEAADQSLERAYEVAQKGVQLNETYPWSRAALGNACLWKRHHDQAIAEYERAIAEDPNFAVGYMGLGWVLVFVRRSEEAIELINHGIRLDPHYPDNRLHWLAQAYFQLGRYEEAIELLKRRLIRKPDTDISRILLAASYGHLGRKEEAKAEWVEALRVNPNYSLEHRRKILPYKDPADFEKIVSGLRKAGLPEK